MLAEAASADTLDAVARTPGRHRVLVLDGPPGPWLPPGFTGCDGPTLLIGVDPHR